MTDFVTVPGGWFRMGSTEGHADERPVHRVWVDTFEIGVDPVTRREYREFVEETAREPPRDWHDPRFDQPDLPVVGVSWNDAVVYCLWHSSRDGRGRPVRLPTEAEWERAARGGDHSWRYPWGNEIPDWIPNRGKGPLDAPWAVTLGPPTILGLRGIGANIHEWCADWHGREWYARGPVRNPRGPATGVRRTSRGGSWRHAVTISRNAARSKLDPAFRYTDYGFRLARTVGPRP